MCKRDLVDSVRGQDVCERDLVDVVRGRDGHRRGNEGEGSWRKGSTLKVPSHQFP